MPFQTILLTGASGLIGNEFLKNATLNGYHVRALTRKRQDLVLGKFCEVQNADLAVECDFRGMLQGVDIVVHAAAELHDKNSMKSVNVDGSLRLLSAAIDAGVRRWVQVSSVGAYGPIHSGVVDESWSDSPKGLYEKTKSDFDLALIAASKCSDLEVCIVRPSNVYGTGMRNQSIKQMLNTIRRGFFAFIGPEGGSANYVHVEDVVQALMLCIAHPNAVNKTYIVSAWAVIEDMVRGLSAGAGLKPPVWRVSLPLASIVASVMQIWPKWPLTISRVQALSSRSQYSTKKIETELGWKLKVPVKEGMRQFSQELRK